MKKLVDDVEHGRQISTTGPKIIGHTMKELLGMADDGQHREGRFDDYALIPSAFGLELDNGGDAVFIAEAESSQGDGRLVEGGRQGVKGPFGTLIGSRSCPTPSSLPGRRTSHVTIYLFVEGECSA